jgi:hypothetical protein
MNRSVRFQTGLFPATLALLLSGNALATDGEFHPGLPPGHPIVKEGAPSGISVGYVNATVLAGWNLLQNPLDNGLGNRLGQVLKQATAGTVVLKPVSQGWIAVNYLDGWSQSDWQLLPGEGFFLFSPTNATLAFSGQISDGIFLSHLPAGDSLVGSSVPANSGPLTGPALHFPSATPLQIYRLRPGTSTFDSFVLNGTWHPTEPKLIPADAFWVREAEETEWRQMFSLSGEPLPSEAPVVAEVFPTPITGTAGLVDFFTRSPDASGSRIYASDGVTPLGAAYVAQLWARLDGFSLEPISDAIPFGTGAGAGWVDGGLITLPDALAGRLVTMRIRCWPKAAGATYAEALAAGAEGGNSAEFDCQAGALQPGQQPGILPGITTGFASFRTTKLEAHPLRMVQVDGKLELRWPSAWGERAIEVSQTGGLEGGWSPVTTKPVPDGDEEVMVVPLTAASQFFRRGLLPY